MEDVNLTNSEWYVLDCLWARSPQGVMELAAALKERLGWAKSTTLTTLRRMEAKGLIRSTQEGRGKRYTPEVVREQAVRQETRSFLDKVYQGSVRLLVSSLVEDRVLTKAEIEELYTILRHAEEEQT